MTRNTYVITGASGNIGRVLSETLLADGKKVHVIGRNREHLQPLINLGAQASFGNLEDTAFLSEAFHGAAAVFAMIPPNPVATDFRAYQGTISDSLVSAIKNAGVSRVVALSSIGADLERDTGPIKGLHDFELKLEKLNDVNILVLRPAFFMENLLQGIPVIKALNANGGVLRADVSIPMIATGDIGVYAAKAMENESFTGFRIDLLPGPENLNMTQATAALGSAIGKDDLGYIQIPEDQSRQALSSNGMSDSVIDNLLEMARWINGNGMTYFDRDAGISTQTTIKDYAKSFAIAFNGGEQSATASHA